MHKETPISPVDAAQPYPPARRAQEVASRSYHLGDGKKRLGAVPGRGSMPFVSVSGDREEPSFAVQQKVRSEEHTSELQSRLHLVCRLLLEKKKKKHQDSRCKRWQ